MSARAVWKFSLPRHGAHAVQLPAGARPLAVQMQDGAPRLWALVDPAAPKVWRHARIVATGETVTDEDLAHLEYVATWQNSTLVWHLFMGEEYA
jgi:hypothetical protein